MNKKPSHKEDPIEVFKQIKEGLRDPKTIGSRLRCELVGILLTKNYTKKQLATYFKVHERTICRDIAKIYQEIGEEFVSYPMKQAVGKLVFEAEQCKNGIMAAIESPGTKPGDKIQALRARWSIEQEFIKRIQSLGLLPNTTASLNQLSFARDSGSESQQDKRHKKLSPEEERIIKGTKLLTGMDREMLRKSIEKAIIENKQEDFDKFCNDHPEILNEEGQESKQP